MEIIKNFGLSFKMLKEDKVLLLLSLIPIFIGFIFYGLLGGWIFSSVIPWGNEIAMGWLSVDWLGSILGWLFKALVTILFFFSVNWTFFLIVSLLASPFNDVISSRVEKKIKGEDLSSISSEFSSILSKVRFVIFNESKKFIFILTLSMISLVLSFIPFLTPLSILLQAILVALNFLDYSWARNDYTVGMCFKNFKQSFLGNIIGGFIGIALLSVPGVNLMSLPVLVIYFSINYNKTTI